MRQVPTHRGWAKVLLAAVAGTVAVLSLVPAPDKYLPDQLLLWDKLQHALAYSALAAAAGHAFRARSLRGWNRAALVAVAFGILMEIAQGALTDTRAAEVADAVADAAGAYAGILFMMALQRAAGGRQ
ncbi:MAG TPA: VanZ family protein [Verrucomicrobiae bacterium]|nr:VanZ family protein [Verrucomicrobiae bacterium]